MKVGGSPTIDPGRLLDQTYKARTAASTPEQLTRVLNQDGLLKGRVLSIDEAGILTVATEQGSFTASSSRALAVGREFWFQVVQSGANPTLAEAGKTNAVLNLLRVLLPEMLAGESALPVTGLLDAATSKVSAPNQDDLQLVQFLADNAVDGKADPGKLLKLISHLQLSSPSSEKRAGPTPADPFPSLRALDSPALQKLARLLDAHATVNQQPATTAGSDFFLFPVFFTEQAGRGEWLLSYEQNSGEAGATGVTAISFYLAMTQLGEIHLSLSSRPNALSGVFTLATEEATDHVRQHLPQLTAALSPLAETVAITCRTAKLDCLKTLKDDLMAKAGLERFALIDLKA
jgi:hypothetical protein